MPALKKKKRKRRYKSISHMQEIRRDHAQKMLDEHMARLKREVKLVDKWRMKVIYYDRVLAKRRVEDEDRRRAEIFPARRLSLKTKGERT